MQRPVEDIYHELMRYLLQPFVLSWRYWPQLAACYLAGLLMRRGAIALAAWAGHDNKVWAALIMPMAGLALMGSYVAMFLVLRQAIPELAALPRRSLRGVDLFTTVIVPFFAIYLAWQLFKEDWLAYEAQALNYRVGEAMSGLHPNSLPVGTSTWVLIGAALVTRTLLSWLSERLPTFLIAVRIYIDALWVFLVLSYSVAQGFTFLINPAAWIAQRRIVVWFNATRAELFSHFKPLTVLWQGTMWALRTALGGAAVPLMWLAVAGIVYGVTANIGWRDAARRVVGDRGATLIDKKVPADRLQKGWRKMPSSVRGRASEYALSKTGRFRPIVDAARLILHGGPVALSAYVLAYLVLAWLDRSGSFYGTQRGDGYLFRGMAWVLGPHGWDFWVAFADILGLASHLIVEPLRVALIVTIFAYCLHHVAHPAPPGSDGSSQHHPQQDFVAHGEVHGSGHRVGRQQETELHPAGPAAPAGGAVGEGSVDAGGQLGLPASLPVSDDAEASRQRWRARPVDGDHG